MSESDASAKLSADLSELQRQVQKLAATRSKSALVVIAVSLILGAACIASVILKSWFREPLAIDWFLGLLGVVLAGFSLFKTFQITKDGLVVQMADIRIIDSLVKNAVQHLMRL